MQKKFKAANQQNPPNLHLSKQIIFNQEFYFIVIKAIVSKSKMRICSYPLNKQQVSQEEIEEINKSH